MDGAIAHRRSSARSSLARALGRARADVLAVVLRRAAASGSRCSARCAGASARALAATGGRRGRRRSRVVLLAPSALRLDLGLGQVGRGRDERPLRPVAGGGRLFAEKPLGGFGSGSFRREYRRARERVGRARDVRLAHDPDHRRRRAGRDRPRRVPRAARGRAVAAVARRRPGGRHAARVAVAAAFAALVVHTLLYAAFLEDPLTWALLGARDRPGGRACATPRRRPAGRDVTARRAAVVGAGLARRRRPRGGCSSRRYPNYDAYYHLVWGRELLDGLKPSLRGLRGADPASALRRVARAASGSSGEDADRAARAH